MKKYIGTKELMATPMTRGAYNEYRGWLIPENEDPSEMGYLVEYLDGGSPNDGRHKGYISWSPQGVFERAYRPSDTFLDRINIELADLTERHSKLKVFLSGSSASQLDPEDLELLTQQEGIMLLYINVLTQRRERLAKSE